MAQHVQVKLGERAYPISVGTDLPAATVLAEKGGLRGLLVSDANVDPLYGASRQAALAALGVETQRVVVPAGEGSKDLKWAALLYAKAVEAGLERASVIVALGGGVVGDLAGFVAATYLRGIRLLQMPTTLLAMVDSSVGGKTGVNLPEGKNLVGAFHQPVEVVADLATLATLPQREYVSGLAEVVKYGVIWDAQLFGRLEAETEGLLRRDLAVLEPVVARCCEIKAEVVAIDEREHGPRAILNFGHTLGHALEQVSGYSQWLHGEAVAIGMAYAAWLSVAERQFKRDDAARIVALLNRLGLPVGVSCLAPAADWGGLASAMRVDKKSMKRKPRFVLVQKLGAVVTGCEVAEDVLAETWHACCE